jgi:hypothetical protein
MSRREVDKWKDRHDGLDIDAFYYNTGGRINDIFKSSKMENVNRVR